MSTAIRKAALDGIYLTGSSKLLRPLVGGVGAVLMLHRIRPGRCDDFQPNLSLELTPDFLEEVIQWLQRNSYEFVSLDEVRSRLVNREFGSRFVSITLDDGYRDNRIWAKPIFERYGIPYTIYVPTSYADGSGDAWWLTLEEIIAANDRIEAGGMTIATATTAEKYAAFEQVRKMVADRPTRADEIAFVDEFARCHGRDAQATVRNACMDWNELRELVKTPLATIGAHTKSHLLLAKASDEDARAELIEPRRILGEKLGVEIRHLAYPFGTDDAIGEREFRIAAEAGYATAFTTQLGVLKAEDSERLTALPRINIDGRYQRERYVDVLVSGVAPAIWEQVRHIARRAALGFTGLASVPLADLGT